MKTYKPVPLEAVMATIPAKRRAAIEARGRELLERIDRRATLAEMRKSRKISQSKLADVLGVQQTQVSRLERRKDPRLSTLRRTVEALGGQLNLVATFPDQKPVVLAAAGTDPETAPRGRNEPRPRGPEARARYSAPRNGPRGN